MTYLFGSGIIKCLNCGSKFRGKMQRDKKVYLCTNYVKNGNSACERMVISEEEISYTVSKHFALLGKRVEGSLSEYIRSIEVRGKGFVINYKDGKKSIINDDSSEYGVKVKY